MAEAYGKLTGEPGVLFVTRGPGATNGAIGVHTGFQDSTPMVVFIGQVGNEFVEREAFQEIDYRRMYGQMAKWVAQIDRVERIPEYVSHAFHTAMAGRPGPVVLALPEDTLFAEAAVADVPRHHTVRARACARRHGELKKLLGRGEASRSSCSAAAAGRARRCDSCRRWIERTACRWARRSAARTSSTTAAPRYAGDVGIGINPKLAQRVKDADVLLVIGARLGEMTTSAYTPASTRRVPQQTLIHVHAGAEELGPRLPAGAGHQLRLSAVRRRLQRAFLFRPIPRGTTRRAAARKEYLEWIAPRPMPGALQYGEIIRWLSDTLPEDTIVAGGAGNFAGWLHRHFQYKGFRTQLGPTNGSMGYGYPAAVAAKLAAPQRNVLAICGDGDFLMNGQELATAVQYGADFRRAGGQQRPLRHDPHAPGARIPRARLRHRT